MSVQIHPSWKKRLETEFDKPYFRQLTLKLKQEKKNRETIYPKGAEIFNAYDTTPFDKVKVIILGQDPYHGPGQAHGLSFSVKKGVKTPPSLQNIYKELKSDIGFEIPGHGELTKWAEQGVLLLNAILTVRARQAASHRDIGWEQFTDATIRTLSEERDHLVFMLWGNFAKNKQSIIANKENHLILKASHPSPFSAHNGFFGTNHFSKANDFLKQHNIPPVDWSLTE